MSIDSYEEGRAGRPAGSDTDLREYNRGVKDRAYEEAAGTPAAPKVEVSGVAYTILLMSPFLFLVYPVLGLTLLGVFAAVVALFYYTPLPTMLEIVVGFVVCVFAFFPGFKLEAKVSQFKPYRFVRGVWRLINASGLTVVLLSGMGMSDMDFNKASGGILFGGIVAAILVHFVFRTLDRLYFPVWAQVEKMQEMAEKGIPLQRNLLKRIFYSLLWIVPVVAVLNLAIRLIVGGFTDGPQERAEFYQQYSTFVYIFDFIAWFFLSVAGILPGTAKHWRSFIDHQVILEQRPQ